MYFEPGNIYHVYNQGNNRQKIFFMPENYRFFLRKISTYVVPYADVIAYCLMPNHFHLMLEVNFTELPASHPVDALPPRMITLNESIGIMLRSYTRAINKLENRSGSLFREETKARCLTKPCIVKPLWNVKSGVAVFWRDLEEYQYPAVCFRYIHNNPVSAGLVMEPDQWEFSSFKEIKENRENNRENNRLYIVNIEKARRFLVTG
jgi:putative transposase